MHHKIGGQMQLGYDSILFLPDTSVVKKKTIQKQINQMRLSSYITKGGRKTAVDLTGHLIKPVS